MRIRKNWFWGLLFIALAGVLLLRELNLTNISVFNIFFTVVFVVAAVKSLIQLEWFGVFFPLGFIYLINQNYFIEYFKVGKISFWAVIAICFLVSIGFSILFKRRHSRIDIDLDFGKKNYSYQSNQKDVYDGEYNEKIIHDEEDLDEDNEDNKHERTETSEDEFYFSAKLNSATKYVYSNNFRRADLQCSMADLKVYFDQAKLNENGADITVNCSLGSITLYVPRAWRVKDRVNATLGDVKEYDRSMTNENGPIVNIVGNVNLGDLKIIYI